MRKKLIVLTTILGLIAFSGVAAAEEPEPEDTGDTTFNYGYDETNGVFIWGSAPGDGETDCTLENGELEATYAEGDDGGLLLEDLVHLEEGGEEGESVDSDCALTGGEVAGPQGQVNHGMFLKLFNSMFDGPARGCMVRHVAQSGLGKDAQQVKIPSIEDTEDTEGTEDVTGSADFETVMAECVNGDDEKGEAGVDGQAKAAEMRPDFVNEKLADKAANGGDDEDEDPEELESEDDDSGRRGPPDHARGKGPKS